MATSTLSNVGDTTTSTTLIAANDDRVYAQIVNDSAATLYVKEGATASASSFTDKVPPGATWIMATDGGPYKGDIDGVWTSDEGGSARCTERTVA